MLVAIDIGNTNITVGIFNKDTFIANYRMTTKVRRTSDEFGFMLNTFLTRSNVTKENIEAIIVSSVVPKVMYSFVNGIRKFYGIEPIIVGPGIKTGISVQLENPKSVGADRIADAAGAYYTYGGPVLIVILVQPLLMIMSMKTAVLKQVPFQWESKQVPMPYGDRQLSFLKLKSNSQKPFWQKPQKPKCRLVFSISI